MRETNRAVSGRGAGRCIAVGLGALALAVVLSACEGGIGDALGLGKKSPDEFAVVRSAPLTLPPEFTLRPPRPGEARPSEESARDQAKSALLNEAGANPADDAAAEPSSQGEAAFIEQAGAADVDPNIRHMVDREFSGYASEDEGFIDSLIFWQEEEPPGEVVDAAAEAERLRENIEAGQPITEGETPTISGATRRFSKGFSELTRRGRALIEPTPSIETSAALKQDTGACFAEAVGPGGIARTAYEKLLPEAARALDRLRHMRTEGTHPFLALPDARDDLATLEALAGEWRARYRRLVVLGTGGANLGGQALAATGAGSERLLFLDNGDGDRLDRVLGGPDLDGTGFLVISKSGATAETLAQALLVLGGTAPAGITLITQPGDSPVRRLAAHFGLPVLDHAPALGGRYSALSLVGLPTRDVRGRRWRSGSRRRTGGSRRSAEAARARALCASGRRRARGCRHAGLASGQHGAHALRAQPPFARPLVSAALGRVARQGRLRLDSNSGARPGGPAQPVAALPGRPRRQPLHHSRSAGPDTPPRGCNAGRGDWGRVPRRADRGRLDRGPGARHGRLADWRRPPGAPGSASR